MRLFHRTQESVPAPDADSAPAWPVDSLEDVDDDTFAKAIAAGREAESHVELVDA